MELWRAARADGDRPGGQTLIGFPALIDHGDAVGIEVFDEPEVAAARHRVGLRRLFALQIRDALKYLEKNIPDLQKMAVAYMPLGTQEELREQIIDVAIDRAFLQEPLPTNDAQFKQRVQDERGRLTLIANEVARMASTILVEYAAAQRKIKDTKNAPDATADAAQQLQRLVPKNFIAAAPWTQLQHYARYLKAITSRLDKYRADPARDASRLAELRPLEQRYWRLVAERKGHIDARMQEYRWMLEELRVSFFAQSCARLTRSASSGWTRSGSSCRTSAVPACGPSVIGRAAGHASPPSPARSRLERCKAQGRLRHHRDGAFFKARAICAEPAQMLAAPWRCGGPCAFLDCRHQPLPVFRSTACPSQNRPARPPNPPAIPPSAPCQARRGSHLPRVPRRC